jgi:hypothetical protein
MPNPREGDFRPLSLPDSMENVELDLGFPLVPCPLSTPGFTSSGPRYGSVRWAAFMKNEQGTRGRVGGGR